MKTYEYHPFSNIFPLLEGEAFSEFAASIKRNRQEHPIILFEGMILDGRNRYRACLEAGLKPWFKAYEGDDPLRYVMVSNNDRRHLTDADRAFAGAMAMDFHAQAAKERQGTRTDLQPSGNFAWKSGQARDQAAAAVGSSPRSVQSAVSVLKRGTPELIAATKSGHIPVSVAEKLSRVSPQEQNAAVSAVTSGASKPSEVVSQDPRSARRAEKMVAVQALHDEGLGTTEISEKLNLPQTTVSTLKTQAGISANSAGIRIWESVQHLTNVLSGATLNAEKLAQQIQAEKAELTSKNTHEDIQKCVTSLAKTARRLGKIKSALQECLT